MNHVLNKICDHKRTHVELKKQQLSLNDLKQRVNQISAPRGFINSLKNTYRDDKIALIAEIKKASPSKGLIRDNFDPEQIAIIYEKSGASCLSILTDTPYFQGEDHYLVAARKKVSLPVLRKDFMIDPYQIWESRALGADCILIIMAALNDQDAKQLYDLSIELGMDVLVEVHDYNELERALVLKPKMVGVNSRNLKTLEVDIETAHKMIRDMPAHIFKIAESGINSNEDILSLKNTGAQGFLVGESLMRESDVGLATKKLLGTN